MSTIVSIQSQVVAGHVGNAAAVPQMQDAGFTKAVHAGLSAAAAKAVSMAEAQAGKDRK